MIDFSQLLWYDIKITGRWEGNWILRKKEICFIVGILLFAAALWGFLNLRPKPPCTSVTITVDGELYGTYSLLENRTIPINDTNVCEIKNGKATMIEANCNDHLCMKQRSIDSSGGSIICLPNKIVIEAVTDSDSGEQPGFDAVT